jgi:hypothetical protein
MDVKRAVTSEGWGATLAGERQHYFRTDGRSMCNRWAVHAERINSTLPKCAGCRSRLAARALLPQPQAAA